MVMKRYIRNFSVLSEEEQQVLSGSTVCIAGLGGLGGGVLEALARIGVGNLCLVDGDVFDISNLNRQMVSAEHLIGTFKADAAKSRVSKINSMVQVTAHKIFLDRDNCSKIIADADLLVDCLDSIDDRFLLQDVAQRCNIPLVSGAIAGTAGQVTTIFPGDPGFELIYGKNRHRPEKTRGVELELGNLSFSAMFIAAVQASESVKVLLNKGKIMRNKIFIADLMQNTFEIMELI